MLPQLNACSKSSVFSYQIRFTAYTNEHQFDRKFSQIEHKPGAFESGKFVGILYPRKFEFEK